MPVRASRANPCFARVVGRSTVQPIARGKHDPASALPKKGADALPLDVRLKPKDRTIMRKQGLTLRLSLTGLLSSPWARS